MTASVALAAAAGSACLGCLVLLRALHPVLVRYALARPNARSSHTVPTPQGAGVAVVAATLAAGLAAAAFLAGPPAPALPWLAGGTLALGAVGAIDDVRALSPAFRLLVQVGVAAGVVAAGGGRVLPDLLPAPVEGTLLVLALAWWVNGVNFMDGLDWMTVVGVGPLSAFLAIAGIAGSVEPGLACLLAALAGALAGFAPANRPVARVFLGDVGSLPIGLLTGAGLLDLARHGGVAAACLLPLYYVADTTVTLFLRLRRGERIWEAHRSHYYQRATANGWTVPAVNRAVLALNAALAALAAATLLWPVPAVGAAALAAGAALVAATLARFARRPGGMREGSGRGHGRAHP